MDTLGSASTKLKLRPSSSDFRSTNYPKNLYSAIDRISFVCGQAKLSKNRSWVSTTMLRLFKSTVIGLQKVIGPFGLKLYF